jgi:Beta-lactamase enzyme family
MTFFKKYFTISLAFLFLLSLNLPLLAADSLPLKNSAVKTKKVHHSKTIRKKAKKRRVKRVTQRNKPKKFVSVKKKRRSSAKRRPAKVLVEKDFLQEKMVRPSLIAEDVPLQDLVEKEILYLKSTRHLLSDDQISLQVYDLNEKKMLADVNGDVIRNSASLIKIFIMLAVYDHTARKELPETNEIEQQVYRMIAFSDNGATNYLIRRLGHGDALQGIVAVNALLHKMDFSETHLRELIPEGGKTYANRTSVADATKFFRLLYEQKLINPQYSQKMTDILRKNIHDRIKTTQIKQDGIAVADKTGYVRGLNGDCGIVYQGGLSKGCDYVLSIIIENKNRPPDGTWGRKKSSVIRYLSDRIYLTLKQS